MIFINAFRVYDKQQNNIKITHMIFTAIFTWTFKFYTYLQTFIYKNMIIYSNNPIFSLYLRNLIMYLYIYILFLITINSI